MRDSFECGTPDNGQCCKWKVWNPQVRFTGIDITLSAGDGGEAADEADEGDEGASPAPKVAPDTRP